MSEVSMELDVESGTSGDQGGPCPGSVSPPSSEAVKPNLLGLQPRTLSADLSPSSPAQTSGLLSLPWEMITLIASYLPAHCVIHVLSKVCPILSNLMKDKGFWQLRVRRLIGPQAVFPVGPREDFDWVTACVEMEKLIICWRDQTQLSVVQSQEDERGQQEPVAEGPVEGGEANVEGDGAAFQQAVFGADGEEVLIEGEAAGFGEDDLARLALIIDERDPGMLHYHGPHPFHRQEDVAEPGNLLNRRPEEIMKAKPSGIVSVTPALEYINIHTDHIASINDVLLVGGEGKICATASRDGDVKLWDVEQSSGDTPKQTLRQQGESSSHQGWVWCLASQGPLLASGSFSNTVRLWDLQDGGAERHLLRTDTPVLCLTFQSDVLLAGTVNRAINMYDTRASTPLVKSLFLHGNAVMCVAADDNYIISGSKDCTVAVYDRRADKTLEKLRLNSYLRSISWSGNELWAGDNKGKLFAFSFQAGKLKKSRFDVGHENMITGIHKSSGSLYTCSSDSTVRVHIPCSPPRTLSTNHHRLGVCGMSVEAGIFAVATGDTCVEVWRPKD